MENEHDIFHDPRYRFHPALSLDLAYPSRARRFVTGILGVLTFLSIIGLGITLFLEGEYLKTLASPLAAAKHALSTLMTEGSVEHRLFGGILVLFVLYLIHLALGWFYASYYYYVEGLLERGRTGTKTPYSTPNFETNELYIRTRNGDLLESFVSSSYGKRILLRTGLDVADLERYLRSRTLPVDFRPFAPIAEVFTLRDVVGALLAGDPAFAQYVFEKGARPEDIAAASQWVERELKRARRRTRWWGRVSLGQSRGIGADLSYGVAYALERYGVDLTKATSSGEIDFRHLYGNDAIAQIENTLVRGSGANVLLVGQEGGSLMNIVTDFTHDVVNGFTHHSLASKHVILFDWKRYLAGMRTKQELESGLIKVMNSAVHAKNVIIVIDDYPGFLLGARALQSDVIGFLDPYAASGRLQFIATSDVSRYHSLLEENGAFRSRFDPVMVPEPEVHALEETLEDAVVPLERRHRIFFSYPAIRAIHDGAKRYFVDAVMPDTALGLLGELAPAAEARHDNVIGYDDVMNHIQAKTHIPVGTISAEERDKLSRLEEELQMHVIGQHKAIEVISNALRRQRAGVRNPNRPIGTFLFLGPTGVGKTETAKALARVFFKSEEALSRLDMSEFQSEDGLLRLIGTDGRAGILANMLREKPYGVLLLDEFEKTHPKVLDLFLQVFDEGVFHDSGGRRVNAQNTIIIATSNAGAAAIRDRVARGIALESVEKEIVDAVITEGKYKPELLNRFDGIVIFHPMTHDEYAQVALLMLEKLKKRLREKNIDITINDVLIEALLAKGVDPNFGARPMNRAVQELVEQKVAEKIIHGDVHAGMTITFAREDFPGILS